MAITDIEALVPENHLVRKIEKVMDYEWIYERVAPYYSTAKDVRPGTDPVVLIKMVLDKLPHSATVSYAFCRWFPEELAVEIFKHILNKALNNRLVDSSDEANDQLLCPQGQFLRHTATNKDGKRIYRSTPKVCRSCPCREQCGANAKGQKVMQRHIWQEAMDLAEQLCKQTMP